MRIDALNNVAQLYQTSGIKKSAETGKIQKRDSLEISSIGKDIQVAKQAAEASTDVRMDKVEAIKAQMAAGIYSISDEDIADKLVDDFFGISF